MPRGKRARCSSTPSGSRGKAQLINTELQRIAGITVDIISATGAQLVPRYQQEAKAGQPSADIMEGSPTTLTALRTDGSFLSLKDQPLPVLPSRQVSGLLRRRSLAMPWT